jgi:hypothetical protein
MVGVGGLCMFWRRVPDWIYWHLIHSTWNYRQLQRYRYSTHRYTHYIGFSVFTTRIRATNLWHSHCHFTSHMKSFLHSLIYFLSLFCSCQFRRLDLVQFLCSPAHILAGWHLETRLSSSQLKSLEPLCTDPAENTAFLLLGKHVYSAVAQHRKLLDCCLFVAAGMFAESLPSSERLFWLHCSNFRASCHSMWLIGFQGLKWIMLSGRIWY